MAQKIQTIPVEFPSADGVSTLHGTIWLTPTWPAARPRGIVQIVHGMSEHHGRYDDFARFLAKRGFVVCAHDHIGHGKSADPSQRGDMPAEEGEDILVEDVNNLRYIMSGAFPSDIPYFIFGHSMGSLVTRVYLAHYAQGLAGAIICGTAHEPLLLSGAGNVIARLIAHTRGNQTKSNLLHSLTNGAYAKAIENAETPFDWLSVNRQNVQNFIEDEMTGFMFTAGGYATLTKLALDAASLNTISDVPRDLPLLFIAGMQDPVGGCGRNVIKAAELYGAAGMTDTELILYPGMRHEILGEDDRDMVHADILDWLERHDA